MKRIVFAVLLSFGASSIALAADIPPPPPAPRAPATYVPAPVPLYNWTGFYLGPNIGWGFGGASGVTDTAGSTFATTTQNSFLGGGQVGVNWQFWGGVVIGAEADFEWLPNTSNTLTATNGGATATGNINNRWLTLADARLGYAWDRLLVYGKGGGAFIGTSNSGLTVGGTSFGLSGTSSSNTGWNAGVGLEYAFWGTWSARVEYDYVRMNTASYTVTAAAPPPFGGDVISTNNRTYNLVTLGLNYKFGGW
jgi:outer membrane immunogenic protein